jgi:shikimate kinase
VAFASAATPNRLGDGRQINRKRPIGHDAGIMTNPTAPIFLIGYRGTGKTTVSRLLAGRLGFESIDADDQIERRAGKTIAAIFADDGEAAFRDLEATVMTELCRRTQLVVAPGGGAVLREATRDAMRAAGPVVWLTASVDTISARLAADAATGDRRPNLTAEGGRAEIDAVLAERTPIYRACATFVVDTEGKSPAEVADEIIARLPDQRE